jgi:rare lipoprotein A
MRSRTSVALALVLAGCGEARPATPAGITYGRYAATGLASWYGDELAGARTAMGTPYDPAAITVAHRTLPLGSLVEVTALDTGRAIVARVGDRGPGRDDRLVDLSRGAAQALGTDRRPLARVRVREVVGGTVSAPRAPMPAGPRLGEGRYLVQIAAFSDEDRARALAGRLGAAVERAGRVWRVRVGPVPAAEAQRVRDDAAARGYADAVTIPLN